MWNAKEVCQYVFCGYNILFTIPLNYKLLPSYHNVIIWNCRRQTRAHVDYNDGDTDHTVLVETVDEEWQSQCTLADHTYFCASDVWKLTASNMAGKSKEKLNRSNVDECDMFLI